jgi:hypothetical protein
MENQIIERDRDNVEAIALTMPQSTETFGGLAKKLAKDTAGFAIGTLILPTLVIGTTMAGYALAMEDKVLTGTIMGLSMWGLLYMEGSVRNYGNFIDDSKEEIKDDFSNLKNYLSR